MADDDYGTKVIKHPLFGMIVAGFVGAVAGKLLDSQLNAITACLGEGLLGLASCLIVEYFILIYLSILPVVAFSVPLACVWWFSERVWGRYASKKISGTWDKAGFRFPKIKAPAFLRRKQPIDESVKQVAKEAALDYQQCIK
jgi:hypothetical protein